MDSSSSASVLPIQGFPEEAECLELSCVAASSSFSSIEGKAASAGCVLCLCGRTLVPRKFAESSMCVCVCVLRLLLRQLGQQRWRHDKPWNKGSVDFKSFLQKDRTQAKENHREHRFSAKLGSEQSIASLTVARS